MAETMRMKVVHKIICVLLVIVWSACTNERLPEVEDGRIVLNFASGLSVSRANEYQSVEAALSHLDIFIWNLDGDGDKPGSIKHYERINGPLNSPTGTVSLQAQRNDFGIGTNYRVDVIANATASEADFRVFDNWTDLKNAVQEDYRIQLTGGHEYGSLGTTIGNIPSYFLMDGIAFNTGGSGTTAQLNTGSSDDTELSVTLNRAAAKVEVKLAAGTGVEFLNTDAAKEAMGYYLRNLCYSTNLLSDEKATHNHLIRKTDLFADATNIFFHWTKTEVSIGAYVYSHHWTEDDFFDKGTRMIVNLPLKYNNQDYVNSFYQILLTKGEEIDNKKKYGFDRNTRYVVNATINAPGAIDESQPIELQDLNYSAQEWTEYTISIGEDTKPNYLSVNKETLDMHNIAEDATSLSFVSSSEVDVAIESIWYINKFGNPVTIGAGDSISVAADSGLSGNITVTSPVPVNNAIRYIRLKVNNQDDSEEQMILVSQYPLEYITNIQGYYSYRSDFGGTTYERYVGNRIIAMEQNTYNLLSSFNTNGWNEPLFGSKVASLINNGNGKSDIKWYFWIESGWGYKIRTETGTLGSLKNARMYHVRITSTSGKYKVGIPEQYIKESETVVVNGENHYAHYVETYEETNDETKRKYNNELVSPSFMIASQLGATQPINSYEAAAKHCANYVEVYEDENGNKVHLTNWRLPTQAEIQIITEFQPKANEKDDLTKAVDRVLSGTNYWSALGIIETETGKINTNVSEAAIRCVRDAY